jgi:hypothetical protein
MYWRVVDRQQQERRSLRSPRLWIGRMGALGVALLLAHSAGAQEPAEAEADEEKPAAEAAPAAEPAPAEPKPAEATAEGSAEAKVEATYAGPEAKAPAGAAAEGRTGLRDDFMEQHNGFVTPPPAAGIEWHGGLEVDLGYASYTFENIAFNPEDYYDYRGRFVFGPTVTHKFGDNWFVRARGEAVGWVREDRVYQINVDDAWGGVGQTGVWDVKAGRFQAWRVYHKGPGFDLYTLEDTGPLKQNPYEGAAFGPHTYEVSYIYLRETPGHLAAHIYPTDFLGFEVIGAYGKEGTANTYGGRVAGVFHIPYLRVSAAGEMRHYRPAQEAGSVDATGARVVCDDCGVLKKKGFGGGLEVTIDPIEIGLNGAQGTTESFAIKDGTFDRGASGKITSLGGYAQVDAGSLIFNRSLILGFGANRTELLLESNDFEQTVQGAGYILYPLGFNAASVKLVVSNAKLTTEQDTGDGVTFIQQNSAMTSGRVRLTFPF